MITNIYLKNNNWIQDTQLTNESPSFVKSKGVLKHPDFKDLVSILPTWLSEFLIFQVYSSLFSRSLLTT